MTFAFANRGVPFASEVPFRLTFKGRQLSTHYRADFVCYDAVIVEIKALSTLSGAEAAQVLNYLRASKLRRGLLLNFGTGSLQYRRFVLDPGAGAAPSV